MTSGTSKPWRRWLAPVGFLLALLVGAFVTRHRLVAWFGGADAAGGATPASAKDARAPGASSASNIDHYTCSMHPSVRQQSPGKCPICGMDLIAVTKQQQEQGVVMIDEGRRQLIGVKTGAVVEAPLKRTLRAVGRVAYDESTLSEVNLKVSGWITKLLVNKTGQRVTAGQTLFLLFSPDLYSAQQDFLLATRGASAMPQSGSSGGNRDDALSRAARQRLHLLGMSDPQISAIEAKGTPSESIAIPSPASGFVIEKAVVEGASVQAGARLFQIAALNKVWVEAELYEADLAHVKMGQNASVTLDYLPGHRYDAKVSYVYPYVDPIARTGRVRVELANKELELRPGMFATVELGSSSESRLQVPSAAVVYTGPRRLVFVDLGEGRFRPQEVRLGPEADGMYEVLSGLAPGDVVATSGVFLIAAEARISTAAKYWEKSPDKDEQSPAEPMPAEASPSTTARPERAPAPSSHPPASPAAAMKAPSEVVYSCPMHPEVRSHSPGKCPKCGMELQRQPSGAGK